MGVYSVNSNSLLYKVLPYNKQSFSLSSLFYSLCVSHNKKMTTANGLKLFIIALKLKSTLMSATLDLIIKIYIVSGVYYILNNNNIVCSLSGGRMWNG